MERVTGLGGVFFKADDPEKMYAWYEKHLGIRGNAAEGARFYWRQADDANKLGLTVWAVFQRDSDYFEPTKSPMMLNYRVANLDELLATLRTEGVSIDEKREEGENGKFAWIMDPEGNRIELWEPPAGL
jgi:catechol 2,3-dioxygenase-like lactoylglutathione lyase family enzyme